MLLRRCRRRNDGGDAGEVGVELAGGAAVEPRLRPELLADVAGEGVAGVRGGEGEGEGVEVEAVGEFDRQGGAGGVEVDAAGAAVVGEASAAVAAGVAVEESLRVDRLRVEREAVLLVEGVADLLRQLAALGVEEEAAADAGVDGGGGGGGELAGGAVEDLGGGLGVEEVEGVGVAEVGDGIRV